MIKIVPLAGDALCEACVGKTGDGLDERLMGSFRGSYGLAPGGISRLGHGRKIRVAGGLRFLSTQAAKTCTVPHGNMQHQLPDTVNLGERPGGRYGGVQ